MLTSSCPDIDRLDVSRETKERLDQLLVLLTKWSAAINLVSPSTLSDARQRHIIDSAQLYGHTPQDVRRWSDLGSGAGFPGLVIAILGAQDRPLMEVELVESDQRKATFLRLAVQTLSVRATVLPKRIESLPPRKADIVSARALASLPALCGYAATHLDVGGAAFFLKGAQHQQEIEAARRHWDFTLTQFPSRTDPAGAILCLKDIRRV